MKATGIVRRIDELGRVVIPKEIRRTMRIREGDPLEIYTDKNDGIIFKKYSPVGELSVISDDVVQSLSKVSRMTAVICDRDIVTACSGPHKKDFEGKALSEAFRQSLESDVRKIRATGIAPPVDNTALTVCGISPIISEGECMGAIMLISDEKTGDEREALMLDAASELLSRQAQF